MSHKQGQMSEPGIRGTQLRKYEEICAFVDNARETNICFVVQGRLGMDGGWHVSLLTAAVHSHAQDRHVISGL